MSNAIKDWLPISNALAAWWQSQEVKPGEAAFIMARMVGGLYAMCANDEKHLQEGVDIMVKELRRSAKAGFNPRRS